jgi:enoyl-CoA hydratase/carnithine racemase
MSDLILTQQRDRLFEIVLNRPDKRNAINWPMMEALDDAVNRAEVTPACAPSCCAARAVLLRRDRPDRI